jgi:hypothetical protein
MRRMRGSLRTLIAKRRTLGFRRSLIARFFLLKDISPHLTPCAQETAEYVLEANEKT